MEEIWKDIEGYEGLYQVSNLGRVKSLNYAKQGKEKILKDRISATGYKRVNLSKSGERKTYYVHRLVAETFIPNPNGYSEVNHKDENKSNNNIDNLEWCTSKYNSNYGTRNERQSEKMKGRRLTEEHKNKISEGNKGKKSINGYKLNILGDKNPNAKKVKCITTNEIFTTIKEASEKYNIFEQNIIACCKGKRKSAGKHPITKEKLVWEYV